MTIVTPEQHNAPPLVQGDPVREAAAGMMAVLRANGEDPSFAPTGVEDALRPLRAIHSDLFHSSIVRPAKNPGHQMSILYFDPGLMMQIVGAPGGFRLPAHNHSAWNILYVCDGEMQFRWYKRLDDRSVAGQAKLQVADDRRLQPGQAGIVARPPHDIHELEVTSDYMWMVVVTPEPEVRTREIYNVEAGTYQLQTLAPLPPQLWLGPVPGEGAMS
jgi:predicted metal-dependent enzyme (double-stranded beta helix superfamily)